MSVRKRVAMLVGILILLLRLSPIAAAVKNTGSIEIRMMCNGKPVSGGSVLLYCLALREEDEYRITEDFTDCGIGISQWNRPEAAYILADYGSETSKDTKMCVISEDGEAFFQNLREGIYLVVQKENAPGYLPICPFVVSIPVLTGDETNYQITAQPKCIEQDLDEESPKTGQSPLPFTMFRTSGIGLIWMLCRKYLEKKKGSR